MSCNPSCSSCSSTATDNCQGCNLDNFQIVESSSCSVSSCQTGKYYQASEVGSCETQSVSGCATYDSHGKCIKCTDASIKPRLGICCDTNNNNFMNLANNPISCASCYSTCKTCWGSADTNCLSCVAGGAIPNPINGTCPSCTSTQYWDESVSSCIDCPQSCATCTNASTCTTCKTNFTLVSASCNCITTNGYWLDDTVSPS